MLPTPNQDRTLALITAMVTGLLFFLLGFLSPVWFLGIAIAPFVYWLMRRKVLRRRRLMKQSFPQEWENILQQRVAYFRSLDDLQRHRFRQMVMVFLDETRITGVRTEVDETTRVLVAASAVIPVFNFPNWEYTTLGEVLIYPGSFNETYEVGDQADGNILGMVGDGHLSGVMILSKPSLISGFDIAGDSNNVGIHEFSHLVDKADGTIDGLPPGVPPELAKNWMDWVRRELESDAGEREFRDYAYTNEVEYYAVLTEYFFESPQALKQKNPELYRMLQRMFRQDTATFLKGKWRRLRRVGRNADCPCGSGKKYKHCCLISARKGK